jgi:acetyl esterase
MTLHQDCLNVHALFAAAKRPPLEQQTPPEARESMHRGRPYLQPDPPEMSLVRDVSAQGPAGAIPLRLYRPLGAPAAAALPALVFYHGGGWVIGDLDSHDVLCRQVCNASGAAVVSVDYRLGPEHRYPAAVDDAFAALQWIATHAGTLGIDGTRLAVGGDSAGGNLAAVVALMARDGGGPRIALQLLIYPAVDAANPTPSLASEADVLPLTDRAMSWFYDHYLGAERTRTARDWRVSPALAASHAALPPAYVLTAEHDVLRDEGQAYATTLAAAGVPVEHIAYPGMIHGFITMGRMVGMADTAIAGCAAALGKALGTR